MNARRLFGFAGRARVAGGLAVFTAMLVAGSASAQDNGFETGTDVPPDAAQAAQAAGQAARTAADLADQVAAGDLPGSRDKSGPRNAIDDARDGVVLIERKGQVVAVGSVLEGDGRILTALSPLTHGNNLDARFADGSVMRLKVGHTDRAWDLALLVPQNGRWKKGLRASKLDATQAGAALRAFTPVGTKDVAPSRVIVRGLKTMQGGDSELLRDAIEFTSRFRGLDLGTPIVDDQGNVVAMLAKACAPQPNQECAPMPYGVPVSAIKAFLRTVPANAVPPAPWLGIQGVADEVGPVKGVRVLSVHPQSPAAAAGLTADKDRATADVVVAVNGSPVSTPEALASSINERAVGESVQLLLFGGGKFRQVTVGLRAAPGSAPAAPAATSAQAQARGEAAQPPQNKVWQNRRPRPAPRGR